MHVVEIVPSASALVQSLRGLGYSPETALADLVDNSIAAEASQIDIEFDWNEGDPRVAVLDDGRGLNQKQLVEAMCFGGTGPLTQRTEHDLGRFGLGLKTASLSQCRRMTVESRRTGTECMLAWDVDEIVHSGGKWNAVVPDEPPLTPLASRLRERENGTLVVWERIDARGGLFELDKDTFFLRLQDIRWHLEMVFHRFLGGDARRLVITVNGRPLRAFDPFQCLHPATITMPTERIRHAGSYVALTPYVLPHRDRFANDAEYDNAGGPGGWGERQGFYVYRGKRLVVPGGWLGLGGTRAWTRDESSRLARLRLDLPTAGDAEWRIDVRKSIARPPAALRPRLTAIGSLCRAKARDVFAWRGGGSTARTSQINEGVVWIARQLQGRVQYQVNRQHPAVALVADKLDNNEGLLDALLLLIEHSVPIERIWLDVSEAEGANRPALSEAEITGLAPRLAGLVLQMPGDMTVSARVDALLRNLPSSSSALRTAVLTFLTTKT